MPALPEWELKPHGTAAAARRHRRNGETVCEACRQAETLASAEFRERHPEYVAARKKASRDRYRTARAAGLSVADAKTAMASPARLQQVLAGAS